jgi:HD-GYP domain-containing protein (c-di-GMP phosphodiesterase class II)
VDGGGYPAGLIGNEIPLASRIVAICSTYDTLTARETYRTPMTPQDAMTELRRVAGRQLDADLVESFIVMLERDGSLTFVHGDDADFEAELAFERRARQIAAPAIR